VTTTAPKITGARPRRFTVPMVARDAGENHRATAGVLAIAGLVGAGLSLPAAVLLMAGAPSLIVLRAVLTGRSQASPSSHAPGAASSDAASGPHEPGS
jgi:hypothetical protein